MNVQQRKEIAESARAVRNALSLKTPVTIDDIRAAIVGLGGRVVAQTDDGPEAAIRHAGQTFEVSLDGEMPPNRKLFSLAHELGHLFVHMGWGSDRWQQAPDFVESYARAGYDEEEFQAHEFAAALLMPELEFRRFHTAGHSLKQIADEFGVSRDAALVRGRWLGLYEWDSANSL